MVWPRGIAYALAAVLLFSMMAIFLPSVFAEDRVRLSDPRILSEFGNALTTVNVSQQIMITADLTNLQGRDQPFAFKVKVFSKDVIVYDSWITGLLTAGQSLNPAQSWTPSAAGTYTAQISVVESIDNPVQLANPVSITIVVEGTSESPLDKKSKHTPEIIFDRATYASNDRGVLSIISVNDDLDPNNIESILVRLSSSTDPNGILLTMKETGPNTGIFEEFFYLVNNRASSGSVLHASFGDNIAVEYAGASATASATLSKSTIPDFSPGMIPSEKIVEKSGIIFIVPDPLQDAVVGKFYSYSFCDPKPTSDLLCGGLIDQKLGNPLGGVQPFTFQKETLLEIGGDIPFGLKLHSNGILDGTPIKADAGKTFKFKVCAVDNTRSFVCEKTSLRVIEKPEAGQIGEKSLIYRIVYQLEVKVREPAGAYYSDPGHMATIKHEISTDVTLKNVAGSGMFWPPEEQPPVSGLLPGQHYAPIKATVTISPLPKESYPCQMPPTSLTLQGWSSIWMAYYEKPGLVSISAIYWSYLDDVPPDIDCTTEDMIWHANQYASFGETMGYQDTGGLPSEELAEEKARELMDFFELVGLPKLFSTKGTYFDTNGGTKTVESEKQIGSNYYSTTATITVTLISSEKAVDEPSPYEEKEKPSTIEEKLPKQTTPEPTRLPEVSSWSIKKGGEENALCTTAGSERPCKELAGPLQEGDTVKTQNDNVAVIPFDDGKTQIWLGPDQKMKVMKLSEDERILFIFEPPFQMRAVINSPQGVKTIFSVCEEEYLETGECTSVDSLFWLLVTGTELSLEQGSGETAKLTVLKGEVQVWRESEPDVKVTVGANNQLLLEKGAPLDAHLTSIDPATIDKWWIAAAQSAPSEVTQASEKKGGGCLIATATFGSELAPQIQQLRETRDKVLLHTQSGTSFMTAFNQFYYTFSPTVADLERQNPIFKEAVKITITPLITTLSILNYVPIDSEAEMLGYGIGVILLNVGMYFIAPVLVIMKLNKTKCRSSQNNS